MCRNTNNSPRPETGQLIDLINYTLYNFNIQNNDNNNNTNKTRSYELEFKRLEPFLAHAHQEDDQSYRAHAQADVEDVGSS